MLNEINRHAINDLIEYYQDLNNINLRFNAKNPIESINMDYSSLLEQLITIREFLINKNFDNINAVYRPTKSLFVYKEHYAILEGAVQFFKLNTNENYPIPETNIIEDIANNNVNQNDSTDIEPSTADTNSDNNDSKTDNTLIQQHYDYIKAKLALIEARIDLWPIPSSNAEVLDKISQVHNSISSIVNQDLFHSVARTSQDTLMLMKTNCELVRSDLNKYDELMTNHITKTAANVTEIIEKEYTRFVHRVSNDINAIVAGITEKNTAELATQTKLVQTNMDKFDNKLDNKFFKWFSSIFFVSAFMLFGNSILSSSWAANKIANNAKLVKLSMTCKPAKPVSQHKSKVKSSDDDE